MSTKSKIAMASSVTNMLREDHKKVKALFEDFEQADDAKTKERIMGTLVMELHVHSKLEEELVYPAIRAEIIDDDLMDEAIDDHHAIDDLIGELKKMKPSDHRFDAKFMVLAESVKDHIQEEEGEMFPKAEESEIAWDELYSQVMRRKEQLMAKNGTTSKTSEDKHPRKK